MASSITVSSSGSDIVIHEILDSQGLDHIFTIACSDCATAMAEDQNVLVVYESSLALMTIYDADAIECGTTILAITTDINALIAACPGGGGGSQTLAQTLVLGNATGGENILVNDADAIELENTSLLKQGTYDFGGDGGISRICSVGFEDMWQSGIRHVFDNNGLIRNSTNCFNLIPDSSYDNTLRFKVGSIWTLDNGTTYVCNDASTGAAVWVLQISASAPYIQITQTDAVTMLTNQTMDPLTLGMTYEISLDDGSGVLLTELYYSNTYYIFKTSCEAIIYKLDAFGNPALTNCFVQTDVALNIVSLKSSRLDLNSDPIGIINQMYVANNGMNSFLSVTVGRNCTITIDPLCNGMDGVTIGDNNTVTCDKVSLLNISVDNGVDPIVFLDSTSQTNNAWSGHISKYDSNVDVILPTLGFGDTDIDLANYASFAGNIYTEATLGGNDINSISNGQDKRNYKIICAGGAGTSPSLNIGFAPTNIFANTYLPVVLPYLLSNTNFDNSDNVSVVFNGSNCLVKAVEVY